MKKVLRELSKCLPRVASFLLGKPRIFFWDASWSTKGGFMLVNLMALFYLNSNMLHKGLKDLKACLQCFLKIYMRVLTCIRGNAHNGLENQLREFIDI